MVSDRKMLMNGIRKEIDSLEKESKAIEARLYELYGDMEEMESLYPNADTVLDSIKEFVNMQWPALFSVEIQEGYGGFVLCLTKV